MHETRQLQSVFLSPSFFDLVVVSKKRKLLWSLDNMGHNNYHYQTRSETVSNGRILTATGHHLSIGGRIFRLKTACARNQMRPIKFVLTYFIVFFGLLFAEADTYLPLVQLV